jgi:hypothetical protein
MNKKATKITAGKNKSKILTHLGVLATPPGLSLCSAFSGVM